MIKKKSTGKTSYFGLGFGGSLDTLEISDTATPFQTAKTLKTLSAKTYKIELWGCGYVS
jgi:hypothetical protein